MPFKTIKITQTSIYFLIVFFISNCGAPLSHDSSEDQQFESAELINQLNRELTLVVSEDLFPPPVASRIYAYANIAAYEAICSWEEESASLANQLNGLEAITPKITDRSYAMALITSYGMVAKHLVYREFLVDSIVNRAIRKYISDPDSKGAQAGLEWGAMVGQHIIKWADQDGYNATRNLPKYQPLSRTDSWEPTQPTYGEALEPHWYKLRPFLMDSSSQFRMDLPIPFNKSKGSKFYQATQEVYEMVKNADTALINIAVYWDCNPGPTLVKGHVMQVRKQNTPGGHWMGIHGIIAQDQKADLLKACRVNALLMAGIADAFIASWDTKFYHQLLRPETYINRYIDPDWKPKLESPLFPEFASAHSAVSGVAASILNQAYGEQAFYDDTNIPFGLPPKRFDDVWQAAEEAAKSRLMGGIHYRFGCDAGLQQGKNLGTFILEKIKL